MKHIFGGVAVALAIWGVFAWLVFILWLIGQVFSWLS